MKILIDHRRVKEIPVLEFYNPEAPARLPLLLLLHGFSGKKEHCFTSAYQLAQNGYYAVSIDLHLHGEQAEGEFVPSIVGPRLGEVIEQSGACIDPLLAAYAQEGLADPERVGLLGFSLGGSVIYRYLPRRQPQVRAAVALIAGAEPFWPLTMRRVMQHYPDFGVTEALVAHMERAHTTRPFLAGVIDFPLLMQYGQDDPIVPIEEVRRLVQQVKRRYTRPERIGFVEHAHTGHETPAEMLLLAGQWFEKYLKSSSISDKE
jgi:uncharacterized protein